MFKSAPDVEGAGLQCQAQGSGVEPLSSKANQNLFWASVVRHVRNSLCGFRKTFCGLEFIAQPGQGRLRPRVPESGECRIPSALQRGTWGSWVKESQEAPTPGPELALALRAYSHPDLA